MPQGDKNKGLNKNKRAFVKSAKPVRGDQQKLKIGRVHIVAKKIDKHAQQALSARKKMSKQVEAMVASRAGGTTGTDLNLKYEQVTEKPKKKGHK